MNDTTSRYSLSISEKQYVRLVCPEDEVDGWLEAGADRRLEKDGPAGVPGLEEAAGGSALEEAAGVPGLDEAAGRSALEEAV